MISSPSVFRLILRCPAQPGLEGRGGHRGSIPALRGSAFFSFPVRPSAVRDLLWPSHLRVRIEGYDDFLAVL